MNFFKEKRNELIFTSICIILILSIVIGIPKITNNFKLKYTEDGCLQCAEKIIFAIVNDLQNQGYTELKLNSNTSIRLVPVIQ